MQEADPGRLDESIEVVRVDRAYFVIDGHKRVAIARQTGREFLDAHVSRLRSPYEVTPDIDGDAIERTAREGEFRRHTGLAEAHPDARFALSDVGAYGELFEAVRSHAYDLAERLGRLPSPAEAAADWYDTAYRPLVARGRETVGQLIDDCTDADVYLAMHRHSRAYWGTECDAAECAADMLLAEQRRDAAERLGVDAILGRARRRNRPPALLPLAEESTVRDGG
jgi:hypothetical protein